MKDVIIPLADKTGNGHIELKYCLRSIEMYVPDVRNVFIVGQKPSFLRNVEWISAVDKVGIQHKERNIFQKITAAVLDKRVSDDFFFFNDDHFLLRRFAGSFDHKGSLSDSLRAFPPSNPYSNTLRNTLQTLGGGMDFDTHCPIVFNKDMFANTVGNMEWFKPFGFCIKSVYCNLSGIAGQFYPDLKIRSQSEFEQKWPELKTRKYFSTKDVVLTSLMDNLFPNKSKYER